jgi:hypothetical protein
MKHSCLFVRLGYLLSPRDKRRIGRQQLRGIAKARRRPGSIAEMTEAATEGAAARATPRQGKYRGPIRQSTPQDGGGRGDIRIPRRDAGFQGTRR